MIVVLLMLVAQSLGSLVADLGGTEVLDRAGIDVGRLPLPFVALCGESLEGSTVEVHEGLADNGLHLAVALLHIEHHSDGHTASHPLCRGLGGILHDGHVASLAVSDEL